MPQPSRLPPPVIILASLRLPRGAQFEFQFIFQLVEQRTGDLLVDYRPPDPYVALYLPEQCAL